MILFQFMYFTYTHYKLQSKKYDLEKKFYRE